MFTVRSRIMVLRSCASRVIPFFRLRMPLLNQAHYSQGEWGSGAGKGGGSGGAVRDAGGGFGKMEAAREEEYFKKVQRGQIKKLKNHLKEEISHHQKMITQHQEEISRHNERIQDLKQQAEAQKTIQEQVDSQDKK